MDKIWTPQDVLGRMFYQVRESKEQPRPVFVRVSCSSTEAFDSLCENMGGLPNVITCMKERALFIQATNPETLEYITKQLTTDENISEEAMA